MSSAGKQTQKLRTACDRCYKLKERCTRQYMDDVCGRCDRLGLFCATVRPVRQAGRKPKEPHRLSNHTKKCNSGWSRPETTSYSADARSIPLDVGKWINGLADLSPTEKEKLLFLLDQPETLDCYVVSPMFRDATRRSLAVTLPAALPVLKDAYLACAGALRQTPSDHEFALEMNDGHANLRHAAVAMKTLRALPVSTPQDAALCLNLGISLALFVYSAVGHGTCEITQHCLSMAKPFADEGMLDSDAESSMTFLVLLETMECLVQRRKPTIRASRRQILGSKKNAVDRHLGLCAPLLPYYHDLCVISHSLANTTDASYMAMTERQLSILQSEIESWQPSQPDRFVEQFRSVEIVHLLAQARLFRLAALLVSHRLRYTFGQQDEQASSWANEIMNELELVRQVTKRPARCVTLPFITAAIEVRDPAARIQTLQNVDKYVDQFTLTVQKATKTFLSRVWSDRDSKTTKSWVDSTVKTCVLLASMDTALFGC